jgi:hypothetical protein
MASGGKSETRSNSTSSSTASTDSRSFVDPSQAGYLDRLRAGAEGLQQNLQGDFTNLGRLGQDLLGQGQTFLQSLTSPQAGLAELGGQAPIQGVIDQLGADINQQVERQIGGAGGANSQAALAGSLGGGRNQVTNALVNEAGIQEFGRRSGELRANDLASRRQFGLGAEQLRQTGLGAGLDALPGLQGIGASSLAGQFGGLGILADILGSPTVLQELRSRSTSEGMSRGRGDSFNVGIG